MTALKDRIQNALDEARILILGAQVLFGLQFRGFFERGYDRLPARAQWAELGGLGLLVIAIALLILPGAYHQIVESGNDTERLHRFVSRALVPVLLPFTIVLAIDMGLVVDRAVGWGAGIAAVATAFVALSFFYGIEGFALWRRKRKGVLPMSYDQEEPTPLRDKIRHLLTETRVVLPGVQALLGFQTLVIFTDAFDRLPDSSKLVHVVATALVALSMVLLITPAAYHRMVEQGEETEEFHRFASRLLLAALVPLALGFAADLFVVVGKVTESGAAAIASAIATAMLLFGLWFGLTFALRGRRRAAPGAARPTSARGSS